MKLIFRFLVFLFSFFALTALFAKEINLYDQPKADSKIVATVDLATGIIPIYTPKEGGWVKIADPKNGNVGWIKSSELNAATTNQAVFSITRTVTEGKEPKTYQVFQFGQPSQLTPQQSQEIMKQMQMQQQSMQKMFQQMNDEWNQMTKNLPMVMPVMILPIQKENKISPTKTPVSKPNQPTLLSPHPDEKGKN